jgi:hypothetical protein
MRKTIGTLMLAALLCGFTPLSASAQRYYMPRQQARISQGLANGSITRAEAARIQNRINRLFEFEQQANADGYVDEQERQIIDNERYSIAREIDQLTGEGQYQYQYPYQPQR